MYAQFAAASFQAHPQLRLDAVTAVRMSAKRTAQGTISKTGRRYERVGGPIALKH